MILNRRFIKIGLVLIALFMLAISLVLVNSSNNVYADPDPEPIPIRTVNVYHDTFEDLSPDVYSFDEGTPLHAQIESIVSSNHYLFKNRDDEYVSLDTIVIEDLDLVRIMAPSYVLSNDKNSQTKTVYYLFPYGTLFSPVVEEGYHFSGWYYGGKEIKNDTIVTEQKDHMLTQQSQPNRYTITLDKQNGEEIANVTVSYKEVPTIETPTKLGYMFVNWVYNGDSFDTTKPYDITSDITIKATWLPNTYSVNYLIDGKKSTKVVSYDQENVSLATDELEAFKQDNIVFGLVYKKEDATLDLFVNSSLTLAKWTYTKDFDVNVLYMSKKEEYDQKMIIPNLYKSDLYVELDSQKIEEQLEIKTIGYHSFVVKNALDEIAFEKKILIKEDLGIENNETYTSPISLNIVDAKILVDGEEIDQNKFRIDKNGAHTITVLGADGYENTYQITYNNPNIIKAIWVAGASLVVLIGGIILFIFGRRKVVSYANSD